MQDQIRETHRRTVNAQMVPGWGVDADPKNDPTYPMKHHVDGEHQPYRPQRSDRPDQQPEKVEVLHSNERPNVSAVFGTKLPPSGLSGMIRRAAFSFSESSYGHWLPLMLADRVQMVEGVVDDLANGHIPNVFSEAGWKADWKYNRKAVVTKVAIGTAVAVGIYALLRSRRNSSERNMSSDGMRVSGGNENTQSSGAFANRKQLSAIRNEQHDVMKERLGSQTGMSANTGSTHSGGQPSSQNMGDGESHGKAGNSGTSSRTESSQGSSGMSNTGGTDSTKGSGDKQQMTKPDDKQAGRMGSSSSPGKSTPKDARGL